MTRSRLMASGSSTATTPAFARRQAGSGGGTCLALIGRNGAGKTPLLAHLGGFSRPGRGFRAHLPAPAARSATRRRIGFIRPRHFGLRRAVGDRNLSLFRPPLRLCGSPARPPPRAGAHRLDA